MLDSVGLEKLYTFLTGPFVVFSILGKTKELVNDLKKLLVFFIDGFRPNIELILPNKL